jgi:type I restriction-modification system DNA methylase subunit
VRHPDRGGNFLEENEIAQAFPEIGLRLQRPDFLVALAGLPVAVIEAKNSIGQLDQAIAEACDYADEIRDQGAFDVRIAIGAAGEEDKGFAAVVRFRLGTGQWVPLTSRGVELTALPGPAEVQLALQAADGSTTVTIPDQSEFIDAAINLSLILRKAKIEPNLRPKVIGALVSALHAGKIDADPQRSLESINSLLQQTIDGFHDISGTKRTRLYDALHLSGADFNRLAPFVGMVVHTLDRLNVKAVLQTDTDFLGIFYEAFLRYGYDSNSLGIVFTPRHITRLCVELSAVEPEHHVVDLASGTGGFLVAAFESMQRRAVSAAQRETIRENIWGFDTNPTIWALASLNMFFRGDGKSHIENESSLDADSIPGIARRFDRAYLNPPFSQEGEPERDFIDASMQALRPGGVLTAVVLAGVFADDEHRTWRQNFLRHHRLLAAISLPEDLFYPTAAPTTLLITQAHVPHGAHPVFMARVSNDGYEKLKGRRVPAAGEQLSHIVDIYRQYSQNQTFVSGIATVSPGLALLDGSEWSPQLWLPQPDPTDSQLEAAQHEVVRSIFRAVAQFPQLADVALENFGQDWQTKSSFPANQSVSLSELFILQNGKSPGEKNFPEGEVPYISSGDELNSIVRQVSPFSEDEVFGEGGITVTAFGLASVQPWAFVARGNGGSSVRVLLPKKRMSIRELVWFAAQINLQRWRFFYLRQAILGRLKSSHFKLKTPSSRLPDGNATVAARLRMFRISLDEQSILS